MLSNFQKFFILVFSNDRYLIIILNILIFKNLFLFFYFKFFFDNKIIIFLETYFIERYFSNI
jgi:hypothetical protein